MKKLKLCLLACIAVCALAFFGVACGKSETLAAPKDLEYNIENELSWLPVDGARGYYVQIINAETGEDKSVSVRRTATRVSLSFLAEGDYDIRVRAFIKEEDEGGDWSQTIYFEKGYETGCVYTLINHETEYKLAQYGEAPATIYIEDTYRNKPVTEIGSRAFKGYAVIENVEIGDNVRIIGDNAFYGCKNLKTVTFGSSLEEIGTAAFQSCNSLQSIAIPEGVEVINASTFAYCRGLTELSLPSTLQAVGEYAFADCSALVEVVLPDSLVMMANYAFTGCTALEELTLGEGLASLPMEAFYKCHSLSTIHFAENGALKSIGRKAFADCFALEEVILPDGLEIIVQNAFNMELKEEYVEDETKITVQSKLETVTIPQSVHSVGADAFFGTKFYMDAFFAGDPYIYADKWIVEASVEVKRTIKVIERDAWSADICGIADTALSQCALLEEVYLPNSIKYIGSAAFQLNKKLHIFELTDDSALVDVGSYAFAGCSILEYVILGPKVTSIGEGAFVDCVRLDNLEDNVLTPSSLTRIGKLAFEGTKLADAYDESGVIYAGNWIVGHTKKEEITVVTVHEDAVGICDYAFANCDQLRSLIIPNSTKLKYIGRGAFIRCAQLDMVDLGATQVREIDDYTFYACTGLSKIDLPMRLMRIGRSAFYNCGQLTSIDLKGKLVKEIDAFAFRGCANLSKAELGTALETIGEAAFYGCVSITKLDLPNPVTKVGAYAFFSCQSLTEITFGTQVSSIGDYAFMGCTVLKRVSFSDALKSVGDYAFYDCKSLAVVNFNAQLESIGDYAFFGAEKMLELKLPQGLKEVGRYAFTWNRQLPSVILLDGLTKVEDHAFYGCDVATFYMQSSKKSEEWSEWWNSTYRPIIWGCVLSEDNAYVVSITISESTFENTWTLGDIAEPYRIGYDFVGWATSPDGEIAYAATEIKNAPVGTTLYAVWAQD